MSDSGRVMAESERKPRNGERGYFPDHGAEWHADFLRTTPAQRLAEGIDLSRFGTKLTAAFARHPQVSHAHEHAELDADRILRALTDHGVDFVVVGGIAVIVHGYVHATKDIDLVARREPENDRRLDSALASLKAGSVGGAWLTHAGWLRVLDGIPGMTGYDQLRARAIAIELPGVGELLVAGYDDLVAMKRAAGRPQDEMDLTRLRVARGEE